jgi:pseudoazurin
MTTMTRRQGLIAAAAALTAVALPAHAQTVHEVQMLNVNPADPSQRMYFNPPVLRIEPGDTVRFVSTDRGHNAQTIDTMLPAGGESFQGRTGQDVEVTFTVDGTYGYICQPHQTMGMIGFILVGDHTTNFAEVQGAVDGLRGRETKARAEGYLLEVESGLH